MTQPSSADKTPMAVPARDEGTPLHLLILVMVLTIAPLIVLSQIIAYWRTDVVDDQMFGYYGWRILHGARVYLDVWDNKPPGIYWINALGMLVGHDSYLGVIALCGVALVVSHAAFFMIGASVYYRGASALATILLSFYLTHAYYIGGTNRTETFLVACELTAVALYMRGFARDRWWKWYLAGVFCGCAFLFKQVGLAAWGCMGVHTLILVLTRELDLYSGFKRGLLLLGGAATSVGLAAAFLAQQGALREAIFATFEFNRAYFAAGSSEFPYSFVSYALLREHLKPILLLPLLMAVVATIHAFLWWLRPQYRPPEIEQPLKALQPVCPKHFLLFALWFCVAFYGAMLSPHAFRHYLVPTIPPLMLMVGYLINVLRAEARLLRRLQQRAWVTAAFVVMGYFALESAHRQFEEFSKVWVPRIDPALTGEGRFEPAEWETVGDAVAARTRPDDKIQCLGYLPGVYLRARRLNACRYTTTEKLGQVREKADFVARELERCLHDDPPVMLVLSAGDFYALHNQGGGSGQPSRLHLAKLLKDKYQLVDDIPKFNIFLFKRKDRVDPANDPDLSAILRSIEERDPSPP